MTTGTIAFATTAQSTDYGTVRINQATLVNSPGAGVIPNAWSLKIDGPPIASTQVTISNNYSLWIASGGTYLQGTLTINTGSSPLVIYNPAGTFAYTLTPSAIAANRQLNIPLTTATDTLAVLGLAQTFSGAITSTGGITLSGANLAMGTNSITGNFTMTGTTVTQNAASSVFKVVTPDNTTIPTIQVGQTGAVGWDMSALATTGHFRLYIDGGQSAFTIQRSGTNVSNFSFDNGDVILQSGKKLYVDGGGDTYLYESSANVFDLFVGGTNTIRSSATAVTLGVNIIPKLAGGGTSDFSFNTSSASSYAISTATSGTPTGANLQGGLYLIFNADSGNSALVYISGNISIITQGNSTEFVAGTFTSSQPTNSGKSTIWVDTSGSPFVFKIKNDVGSTQHYKIMSFAVG